MRTTAYLWPHADATPDELKQLAHRVLAWVDGDRENRSVTQFGIDDLLAGEQPQTLLTQWLMGVERRSHNAAPGPVERPTKKLLRAIRELKRWRMAESANWRVVEVHVAGPRITLGWMFHLESLREWMAGDVIERIELGRARAS